MSTTINTLTLIPIKCFTCGSVIGDKYSYYLEELRKRKLSNDGSSKKINLNRVVYLTKEFNEKSIEGEIMDDLGLLT